MGRLLFKDLLKKWRIKRNEKTSSAQERALLPDDKFLSLTFGLYV